ncbi:DUF4159 domain-containing protein [Sandaracinus amylolyticus]|uniref:Membrane protein, putative n=1 Tax=Sandaracinus amylolyticus TaxID=927083 RepID=A0A0F6W5W2_9BACT|nr:DUF4159 domain-containing protein [Sandaracinus amylolyticus]AKF08293.1 membrane protein, putative [Sandaracinus amylolyticus]
MRARCGTLHQPSQHPRGVARTAMTLACALIAAALAPHAMTPTTARALGESSLFDVRSVDYEGGHPRPRETAPRRLAWEVRKRTSIDTRLEPSRVRLDDPSIFETPFLYWSGDAAFPPLSEPEIAGLRRFLGFGGFVLIDDASPEDDGFDASIRRELARAMPDAPLARLPAQHTVFRSFYLLQRPEGRVAGPDHLEGITLGDRVALVYSRHDLGGAWARDNLGTWEHSVTPGGEAQRERAIRLGVNLAMYSLCLDYKDDQVHAPFIMRRRGAAIP